MARRRADARRAAAHGARALLLPLSSLPVTCYPQPAKAKSRNILEAFAAGCGGRLNETKQLQPGPAAFWGVVGIEAMFHVKRVEHQATGHDWYYGDNAFFDCARGTHFRFGRNAYQHPYRYDAPRDRARLKALDVKIKPWRRNGSHILVVEQSDHYLQLVGAAGWWNETIGRIRLASDRPIRARRWSSDKMKSRAGLQHDLEDCWMVVTHSSAAAIEALVAGVPALVTDTHCVAWTMSAHVFDEPDMPDGREHWAAWLASMQWTLEEIRAGAAWRALQWGTEK